MLKSADDIDIDIIGNNLNFVGAKNTAWCEAGEKGCRCRLTPLRWLQSSSSQTNVASNTLTVHLVSSIHLCAFLSSPV